MKLAELLADLGAQDQEIEHMIGCDECRVSNGWDGAEIERCPKNPVVVEGKWTNDLLCLGWCLMAAFQIPEQPPSAMQRAMTAMMEEYKRQIIEQLNTPLFEQVMTRAGA